MFLLKTERLLLRLIEFGDAAALMNIFGDAEVMRFGDGVQPREWVEGWIQTCLESYAVHGFGPYAVAEQSSGEVIGYCGLYYFPDVSGKPEVEIGYRLRRSAWGQGYAVEAARAVRDFAFEQLDIQRLIAIIDPANVASIRVAEKIGMHYESEVMFEGYTHPDHVYVIERYHWK
jgi:ribosomal-protein-alanine N-acetyltransferase